MSRHTNRRTFIQYSSQAAVAGCMVWHCPSNSAQGNAMPESTNSAEPTVADSKGWIDAHVHVWMPDVKKYPIDKSFKLSDMQPPSFTAAELLAHCKPLGVDRIVLIQMSFYALDHGYMFDCMREHPGVFSAVALIDHKSDQVVVNAKDLVRRGARGFRIHSQGDADQWPNSPTMKLLWKTAADDGFSVCALINPQDIQHVDQLCQQFPKTRVVVDHFARIGVSGAIEENRLEELCKLARHPNVYLKTSAFYALGKKQAPYHDLKPMIRKVLSAYGAERLMWATDCPYQVQGDHTYKASLDLILQDNEVLSQQEKQHLLRNTAHKVFFTA
ncbi:MAG: amidohydrolase family protein [Pirellulales bacterium]